MRGLVLSVAISGFVLLLPLLVQGATKTVADYVNIVDLGTRSFAISLQTDRIFVGIQMDLAIDFTEASFSQLKPDPNLAPQRLNFAAIDDSRIRLVVSSDDNSPLKSGTIATLPITLLEDVPADQSVISIENIIITNLAGVSTPIAVAPNIVTPEQGTQYPMGELATVTVVVPSSENDMITLFSGDTPVATGVGQSLVVDVEPTVPGAYSLTAKATAMNGAEADSEATQILFATQAYLDWAAGFWSNAQMFDPLLSWPLANPDGDESFNLLERALGLNPLQFDKEGLPQFSYVEEEGNDYLSLTFKRPVGMSGIGYEVGVSDSLTGWDYAASRTVLWDSFIEDGMETMIYRDTIPFSDLTRRFMQLRVSELSP